MRKVIISIFMLVALTLLTGAESGEVWGPDAPKTTSNSSHARPHVIIIMIDADADMTAVEVFNAEQNVKRMEHVTGQVYRLYLDAAADAAKVRQAYTKNALFVKANYEIEVSYEVHAGCSAGGRVDTGI